MVAPLAGARIEMYRLAKSSGEGIVAPLVGAWIEIECYRQENRYIPVAPLAGARIEITRRRSGRAGAMSLPSRERGLKYPH